jgi:hypothetical protein
MRIYRQKNEKNIYKWLYYILIYGFMRVPGVLLKLDTTLTHRIFLLCVQTGSGAHPVSCTMGTGGLSLG